MRFSYLATISFCAGVTAHPTVGTWTTVDQAEREPSNPYRCRALPRPANESRANRRIDPTLEHFDKARIRRLGADFMHGRRHNMFEVIACPSMVQRAT